MLHCIYFKSLCLVAIPLVDAATLFCLEVTAAKETKELLIIFIIFKIILMGSYFFCENMCSIDTIWSVQTSTVPRNGLNAF